MEATKPVKIGWAGLGAMGMGMSTHLVGLGHQVTGFDVWAPSMEKFGAQGGQIASSPRAAAQGNDHFVCMVANAAQAESVLFDASTGAVQGQYVLWSVTNGINETRTST